MSPMTAAAHGSTNAHGAVMATRPASRPFMIMPGSGLPVRFHTQNMPPMHPSAAAMAVLAATRPNWPSAICRVEPALKPNQPNIRISVPAPARAMLWPGRPRDLPSLVYLPMRGPSTMAPVSAATPPTACTTPEPAKSV